MRIIVVKKNNGHFLHGEKSKIIDICNDILLAQQSLGRSILTLRAYAYDLHLLITYLYKFKITFKNFKYSDVTNYVHFQQNKNHRATTINRRLSTLESFYRFNFNQDLYPEKRKVRGRRFLGYDRTLGIFPVHKTGRRGIRLKVEQKLINPLSSNNVKKFISKVENNRDLCIVYLMLFSGLRSREVISMELNNNSHVEGFIRITGKGNKERIIPVPNFVQLAIDKYIQNERPRFSDSSKLFVVLKGKSRGQDMTPAGIRSLFRYKRALSGVTQANPHRFRHTFGADMAKSGVQLATLQKMMGHADHITTLKYIRLHTTDIQKEYLEAIKKIENKYAQT